MKKSVFGFLLLLFTCFPGLSFSQQTYPFKVPPVIPPSPDAAALGRYGNTPVGLYTGIPGISIPLYTIKTKRLEVPISVSYHALGNKVSEIASWIGLGWALNAGGVVSRSVVGRPDYPSGFWERYNIKTASQITSSDYDYLKAISDGAEDGESDYYFYNFNGRSGKFVYPQNNNQTPYLIPKAPIAISFTSNRFEIKDEMGVLYKFATVEYSDFTDENNITTSYPSSYYLSEIVSADAIEHIYFNYANDTSYAVTDNFYTETIGQECTDPPIPSNGLHTSAWYTNTVLITAKRLSEITFAGGKIEFIKDYSRRDRPESRLNEIRISGKNTDGTFSLLRTISFGEGYFLSSGTGYSKDLNRLKLTEIIEKDLQGNTNNKYSFEYKEDVMLPIRTSLAQDWWGFYNGQTGNSSLINSETITFEAFPYQVGGSNREPSSSYMQACILKKISYPTGGYTEFDYESNYYGSGSMAGGLRVKEIRDYEKTGTTPVKKIYKYGTGETGMGILLIPAEGLTSYKQTINFTWWSQYCTADCWGKRMVITGRPLYDLGGLNGAPVVYPEARVYEENSTTMPNGKQVSKFNVYTESFMGVDQAYCNGRFQLNDNWKGGDKTNSVSYIGNTSNKSQEDTSSYSLYLNNSITGTKVGRKMIHEGICTYVPPNIADFYYFDYPVYSGLKKLTSSTTKQYSSLSQSDYVETQSSYYYDNMNNLHQQLSRKTVTNSAGTTDLTKYWYPKDYDSVSISGALLRSHIIAVPVKEESYRNGNIISGKVTKYNNYGNPYEIHLLETDKPLTAPTHNPNQLVPSGYVKRADLSYDANQNLLTVQKSDDNKTSYIWGYDSDMPIAEINNSVTNGYYFNGFENSDGNSTLNDCKTGRKSRTGGFYKYLNPLQNGTYLLSWWSKSGSTWSFNSTTVSVTTGYYSISLTGQVDDVRLYLKTSTMKTYTYDPQIGLTSVSDENGVVTYYEYDDSGRLKYIKDQDGNIIQFTEYHYKTSN
jgi:YD repeat-containing protein